LRYRQSSLLAPVGGTDGAPCVQVGPGLVASRTPVHAAARCGGFHRSAPTGGAANGMPWNDRRGARRLPRTSPPPVRTRTGPPHAAPPMPPEPPAMAGRQPTATAPRASTATTPRVRKRRTATRDGRDRGGPDRGGRADRPNIVAPCPRPGMTKRGCLDRWYSD